MILFTILTIIMLGLLIYGVAALCVGGIAFIAVFADVIVCAGFIYLIIRWLVNRKKN